MEIKRINMENFFDVFNISKIENSHNSLENDDNFDSKLENFLEKNELVLDVPERKENVEMLKLSNNKVILDDYVIANDFKLNTEGAKITLAYKEDKNKLLISKEVEKKRMVELGKLNQWEDLTVEEYLKEKGFDNTSVILPLKTIEKDEKIYRFYEALDIDLEKYLESHNKLNIQDSVVLITKVCSGVKDLHRAGVANIDLAPLNIVLTKNNVKIIDLDGASIDSKKDGIFGRNYLGANRFTGAPELFEERPIFDKTVDIYAASTNLYRLVCGKWPYDIEAKTKGLKMTYEEKSEAYKKEHSSGKVLFPEGIPEELIKIIKKGMDPDPFNRYQSVEEFLDKLIDFFNLEKNKNTSL